MREIKVLSYPDFDKKAKSVDLRFQVKQGALISPNESTDIEKIEKVKQHIQAEAESYFDAVADQMNMGLIVEVEGDCKNQQIKYIEDLQDVVYNMIYKEE